MKIPYGSLSKCLKDNENSLGLKNIYVLHEKFLYELRGFCITTVPKYILHEKYLCELRGFCIITVLKYILLEKFLLYKNTKCSTKIFPILYINIFNLLQYHTANSQPRLS